MCGYGLVDQLGKQLPGFINLEIGKFRPLVVTQVKEVLGAAFEICDHRGKMDVWDFLFLAKLAHNWRHFGVVRVIDPGK